MIATRQEIGTGRMTMTGTLQQKVQAPSDIGTRRGRPGGLIVCCILVAAAMRPVSACPFAGLTVAPALTGPGCCWDFGLYQSAGAPGNVVQIQAEIQTPGVSVASATTGNLPGGSSVSYTAGGTTILWTGFDLWSNCSTPYGGIPTYTVHACFQSNGPFTVVFTGMDAAGNFGPSLVSTVNLNCECAIPPANDLLLDPGFEPGTVLRPWFRGPSDPPWTPGEWNVENANVINSPIAGISPHTGSGMIRVNVTGGGVSQVSQIIDVTGWARQIDIASVEAAFSIWVNAPQAGVVGVVLIMAGQSRNANGTLVPVGGAIQNGFNQIVIPANPDGTPNTWELASGSLLLPAGTRYLHFEFYATNNSIPPNGVFFDTASTGFCRLLNIFGLPHFPLGQATLNVDSQSGNLVIGNIGSNGEDGVTVKAGRVGSLSMSSEDLAGAPPGARLTEVVHGHLGDGPEQVLWTTEFQHMGSHWQISQDLAGLAFGTFVYVVLQGSQRVVEAPATTGTTIEATAPPQLTIDQSGGGGRRRLPIW